MANRSSSSAAWTPEPPEPPSRKATRVPSDRIPPLPPVPDEKAGWDLLDDYQLGKDIEGEESKQTARFAARLPDQEAPPQVDDARTRRIQTTATFARHDSSAAQDAEVMARIMARKDEFLADAGKAIERAKTAAAEDTRNELRLRQRREIDDYLALQRSRSATQRQLDNSVEQTLKDAADIFLALGICPDHLEYLPDLACFCSWGGRLYDHQEIFSLSDARDRQLYALGPSPHGATTACHSLREQRWRLHHPVAPAEHLTPIERLLPIPARRADGSVRYSARRARTIVMEEGSFLVYVVRNAVYTTSHLRAAHFRDAAERRGLDPLLAAAESNQIGAPTATQPAAGKGGVGGVVDAAANAVSRVISNTTRLWRRKSDHDR